MTIQRVFPLVTTQWLKQRIGTAITSKSISPNEIKLVSAPSPALRVLDTSWLPEPHVNGYKEFYRRGHIPGAFYFDLKKLSTKRPDSPIDCPIPDSAFFGSYVESLGISNSTHVIAYDRLNARSSVRTWFLFRLFGHDNVSVLNGGLTQWERDGFQVTTEEPALNERAQFKVTFRPELLVDFKSMRKIVEERSHVIVDARPREGGFYITDDDTSGGHMPGATSIPFSELFQENKLWKTEKDLEVLFSAAGVDLSKPVVATCQRGMTACGLSLAAHLLGKEGVPVYSGAWSEWSHFASSSQMVKIKSQ